MNRLEKLYEDWTKMRPLKFILVTTLLTIILTMPIAIALKIIGIQGGEIGRPNFEKYGVIVTLILIVIIAPIIETFLGQVLPIYLTNRLIKAKTKLVGISISTILFSLLHLGYSVWYSILIIPTAALLAMTYVIFQDRKESSYWMTTSVHSLKNLIALLFTLGQILK